MICSSSQKKTNIKSNRFPSVKKVLKMSLSPLRERNGGTKDETVSTNVSCPTKINAS